MSTSTVGISTPGWAGSSENETSSTVARGSHLWMASRTGATISTFATGNLVEVAQATGCFLPLIAEHEWRKAIEGLGDIIACHTRRKILRFTDPVKVFRHLKSTGVNALSAKESLLRSLDRYPREADGACHLTYLPIFIVLRKK